MSKNILGTGNKTGFALIAALSTLLIGCTKEASVQDAAVTPAAAPAVAPNDPVVAGQDDFVYYPNYEVYYNRNRHEYRYMEGGVWVNRPAPRNVAINVLLASPSVHMDFHDSPERHHESVMRSYPKNWTPPGKTADDRKHN
jgi:hypothetical protein